MHEPLHGHLFHSNNHNSIGIRVLAYDSVIPEIDLPDSVQLVAELARFVGGLTPNQADTRMSSQGRAGVQS